MPKPVIYWFRQDLRLADLPGLVAAAATGPVIPVFIWDENLGGEWCMGGASQWWLHHSLEQLGYDLEQLGSRLILRRGESCEQLELLLADTGADCIFASRQYQPWAGPLEAEVKAMAQRCGADFKRYAGTLLFEPESVRTGSSTPFKVFTPFWRACLKLDAQAAPAPVPRDIGP